MKAVQLLRHEPFGYRLQRECVTSSSSLVLIQRGLSRCCAPQPAFYLALGLEPIFQIVTVCPSALLVKFVGALLDLLLDGGSGRSARPTSVRVLMAFSRSRLDGDLLFLPVVQSAVLICRLWCVSLPY